MLFGIAVLEEKFMFDGIFSGNKNKFAAAGICCTVAALLLTIALYTLFAPMDIVFMKDGEEVYRQKNASAASAYDDPFEYIELSEDESAENIAFFYSDRGGKFVYSTSSFQFRFRVAKTTLKCLLTFKTSEEDRVIVCTAYDAENQ